jgi:hypothetical protein
MNLPELTSLPETIPASELEVLFGEVLSASATNRQQLEALLELANKQWHCYAPPSEEISVRISAFISKSWNPSEQEIVELVLGVVGHLGLSEVVPMLQLAAENPQIHPRVREEIRSALEEFGPLPLDPYRGMPKQSSLGAADA